MRQPARGVAGEATIWVGDSAISAKKEAKTMTRPRAGSIFADDMAWDPNPDKPDRAREEIEKTRVKKEKSFPLLMRGQDCQENQPLGGTFGRFSGCFSVRLKLCVFCQILTILTARVGVIRVVSSSIHQFPFGYAVRSTRRKQPRGASDSGR